MELTIDRQAVQATRARIAEIGGMLFDRHLTDAAGGNISARVGDVVCISRSLSGQKNQWQIEADDVLVVDLEGNILEGDGKISRESNVHLGLHKTFRDYGQAVIHAHPRNLMVFVAMGLPMPPVLEANLKFGTVPCVEFAPAHSVELAQNIINAIGPEKDRIPKHAFGAIAPWHGLFLMGRDLEAAFDAVERFDTNAYCIMMAQQALGARDMLAAQREGLMAGAARFGKV